MCLMPLMTLLMRHQPHLHQPWRLDRCDPFVHSCRGVASPADISMVSAPLEEALGMRMMPFSDALVHMMHNEY